MSSHERFSRAIDSMYRRLGRDATYTNFDTPSFLIRVIPRRPDGLFELGGELMHSENPPFEFRVSEVSTPRCDDELNLDGKVYRIDEEPRLDGHQLIWHANTSRI